MPNQDGVSPIIAIVEAFILFAIGILGDEIAEVLEIPSRSLFILAGLLFIVLAGISYTKSGKTTVLTSQDFRRFIPKTMVGMFPIGVVIGFIAGAVLTRQDLELVYCWPSEISSLFGYSSLCLGRCEILGVLIGFIISLVFAIFINPHLAAAMLVGYGLALPTAILFIATSLQREDIPSTYIGHILSSIAFGVILMVGLPLFNRLLKKFKQVLTEQRI